MPRQTLSTKCFVTDKHRNADSLFVEKNSHSKKACEKGGLCLCFCVAQGSANFLDRKFSSLSVHVSISEASFSKREKLCCALIGRLDVFVKPRDLSRSTMLAGWLLSLEGFPLGGLIRNGLLLI